MLKLEPIEFFLRAIPEGFLFILAVHTFSKTKLNGKLFVFSSLICSISIFCVRLLPISYGVHTILAMVVTMILAIYINKIDVTKVIKAVLISVIIQFVLEGINIYIIQDIIKVDMNTVFLNPKLKSVYGLPSLIMFTMLIGIIYNIKSKRGDLLEV